MGTRKYQICTNCIMDTTDTKITFDDKGVCDQCQNFYGTILPLWKHGAKGEGELKRVAEEIKKAGTGKAYDCILGLSGGVDSSYLCYVAKELMGLRPLIFVVDTGWNLRVADENIERIVKALDLDVHTEVIDWSEMQDLQLAFLRSQVAYQDLPQDHAIFASLYNYATKHGIKYVLTGGNTATEGIRPPVEWVYQNDITFIKDVHRRFGKVPLKTFPLCGMVKYKVWYKYFCGMKRVAPLDLIEYDYDKVKTFLQERFGWEPYTNKHYENIFTRWYEGYYMPHKFGYDKRRCYFSNLILTNQMTREEALRCIAEQPYPEDTMKADKSFIAGRLGISEAYLDELIEGPNKTYKDYHNSFWLIQLGTWVLRTLGIEKRNFR